MYFRIRRITTNDLDPFYDFFKKTVSTEFPEYSPKAKEYIFSRGWNKERYESFLNNQNRFILGAWYGEKLTAILDAELPFMGVCFCSWIMVDRQFQKKGIGTKLLRQLEEEMRQRHAHMIFLYASSHNNSYYEKLGYEWSGIMKKSWFGQDHNVFTKLLQEPKEENYLK
jgi:ribosomal protein S18 acetylase RimI-like enzyme